MVRHILLWQLKDELTPAEKRAEAEQCKRDLEALVGVVPGLVSLKVEINPMDSSNVDMMLDSTLTDAAAYDGYRYIPRMSRRQPMSAAWSSPASAWITRRKANRIKKKEEQALLFLFDLSEITVSFPMLCKSAEVIDAERRM